MHATRRRTERQRMRHDKRKRCQRATASCSRSSSSSTSMPLMRFLVNSNAVKKIALTTHERDIDTPRPGGVKVSGLIFKRWGSGSSYRDTCEGSGTGSWAGSACLCLQRGSCAGIYSLLCQWEISGRGQRVSFGCRLQGTYTGPTDKSTQSACHNDCQRMRGRRVAHIREDLLDAFIRDKVDAGADRVSHCAC
jgi:hypothetical protein